MESDQLQIFSDSSITIEDILSEKGDKLNKVAVNKDGDLEFWGEDAEQSNK
jgi:hypothetical protein